MSMDRIPPEVLSDIFLKTVSEDYYRGVRLFNESNLRSLRVSHVCRRWHGVATSHRHLWSYFCMSNKSRPANIKATFDLFQARGKDAPLYFDIDFRFDDRHKKPDQETCNDVVYMILSLVGQQHRWVEAKLAWRGESTKQIPPFDLTMTNMPMLSVLYLESIGTTPMIIDPRQSPKLKRIDVSGDVEILTERKTETAEFLQLTSSSLTFPSIPLVDATVRSCLDFLEMAPLLKKFRVTCEGYRPFPRRDPTKCPLSPVIHHKLRSLSLFGCCEPELFLQQMTLPSLMAFQLYGVVKRKILIDFLKRSAPSLTFLRIHCYAEDEDTIIEVLRHLPTLREFQLIRGSLSARFFQELTVSGSGAVSSSPSATLCPFLEALSSFSPLDLPEDYEEGTSGLPEDNFEEAFVSMLESRARYMGTFPKIEFLGDPERRKMDIWELRQTSFWWNYFICGFFAGPDGIPDDLPSRNVRHFRDTIFVGPDGHPTDLSSTTDRPFGDVN